MKKIAGITLCVFVLSLSLFAQSGKTSRPRVVVTDNTPKTGSTPTPNSQTPASTQQNGPRKPPVLIGDNKSGAPAPQQTSAPTAGAQDDVIQDDGEVIKIETSLVTIPVSVLDRNGRYISGLQKSDFHIFEDGVEQKIENFASIEQPFTVVLLLDVSASTQFKIDEIQNAAITFVNQLRQDDRVMVITFDEKVHVLTQPTNNRAQLRDAIRQARFGGGTSLYEAVQTAMERELKNVQGRKAIVLFTDGVDTTSRKASYESTIREAEEIDAMIYPIRYDTFGDMNGGMTGGGYPNPAPRRGGGGGLLGKILVGILTGGNVSIGSGGGGGGSSRSDYEKGRQYLQQLAQVSGGRSFEAQNTYNLDAAFSGIAEELRRQYSISYYPENEGKPGQRKQIKVRVDETNAVVRAKNSYIVGENGTSSNVAAQKPVQKSAPTIKSPSRFPF